MNELTHNYKTNYCSHMANKSVALVFSESLRTAFDLSGLTRRKLGKETGIHPVTLGLYISGKQLPPIELFLNIAEALYIHPQCFFDGSLCSECIKEAKQKKTKTVTTDNPGKKDGSEEKLLERIFLTSRCSKQVYRSAMCMVAEAMKDHEQAVQNARNAGITDQKILDAMFPAYP